LLRLLNRGLYFIESGYGVCPFLGVDFEDTASIEINDMDRSIRSVRPETIAFDVLGCGGRLQCVLFLLSGLFGEDRGELGHTEQCAAGDLRRVGVLEVSAGGCS
jgi:hypothetical protein